MGSKSKSDWFWRREPQPNLPPILKQLEEARQKKYMADRDQQWTAQQQQADRETLDGMPDLSARLVNGAAESVNTPPKIELQDTTENLRQQLRTAIVQGEDAVARLERDLEAQRAYLLGNRGALQMLDQLPAQGAGVFVKVPV